VLPHVEALAARRSAQVLLVRAIVPAARLVPQVAVSITPVGAPYTHATPLLTAAAEDASEYLEAAAARLQRRGLSVAWEQHEGAAADVVLDQARAHHADLIAMTTHGRGGLGRLVFGSVADTVLRRAPCPVLLVRGSDIEEERGDA
jgi:nucleotide-binding universal stress UspA family protein